MAVPALRRTPVAVMALLLVLPAWTVPARAKQAGPARGGSLSAVPFYDSRQAPAAAAVLRERAVRAAATPSRGVRVLRAELGTRGVVSIDPLTGTAREVGRLDGFLTGPSRAPAASIALDYVRAHRDVFGLAGGSVDRLALRRDYVDIAGTHHLSFVQSVAGIPVFGNGLQANVAAGGRLVNVVGSPVAALPTVPVAPAVAAERARAASVAGTGHPARAATATGSGGPRRTTLFAGGDRAELVYFETVLGPRLAWQVQVAPTNGELYTAVVDAGSGAVLYRRDLVDQDNGTVWDNYPGARRGGVAVERDLTAPGWLPAGSPRLAGNVAHVYNDANDDNLAQPGEEVAPTGRGRFDYPFTPGNAVDNRCSARFPCSWDPGTAYSWQADRGHDAVQVLFFIGTFHDHLRAAPIGFTRAAGNFEAVDGDAVQAEIMDGSATAAGLPDTAHVDDANMGTPPDGQPPRMQMYLFSDPASPDDPFLPAAGGDEADIVYHEYTHGLSNRLVVDAMGNSTLTGGQAGAMGEAWSDWYAMDFLADQGLQPATSTPGQVRIANYVSGGADLLRTQPLDCPVGTLSAACPGTPEAGPGGYTYGDFGHIAGGPEVHADGEIWAETLWDLRTAVGSRLAESLVTRAMELSPADPSYLDMRNAILQADQVVNRGRAASAIWRVFAGRGMGWFAGTTSSEDNAPVEDFSLPPPPGSPTGSLTGTVTDQDTGQPIAGALVRFGGHSSGFPGDYAAVTDAAGHYAVTGVVAGTYQSVVAGRDGYDPQSAALSVHAGPNTRGWELRRDWAALPGGAEVVGFTGPDLTASGCGPPAAIDQSSGRGWTSTADFVDDTATPKSVTVRLPRPVDLTAVDIDPADECIAGSASTAGYRLETSSDGSTFTLAAAGTFTADDRHRLNPVPLAAGSTGNVSYVRFTMLSPQLPGDHATLCPGNFAGCQYLGMSELEVYGSAR
jgi:extracellular elastinolytic metalloproteinase